MVFCPLLPLSKGGEAQIQSHQQELNITDVFQPFLSSQSTAPLSSPTACFLLLYPLPYCSSQSPGLSSGADPLKLVCHRAPSCLDSVLVPWASAPLVSPQHISPDSERMSSCLQDITTGCPSQSESPKWSLSFPHLCLPSCSPCCGRR